jgi:hypothetical protein
MTPLPELFERIEGARFSAAVNVASDLKTFLRAVNEQPETRDLLGLMATPEVRRAVRDRVVTLTGAANDRYHEHPHDVPVATYVLLLSMKDEDVARDAALHVSGTGPWWWADQVVNMNFGVGI